MDALSCHEAFTAAKKLGLTIDPTIDEAKERTRMVGAIVQALQLIDLRNFGLSLPTFAAMPPNFMKETNRHPQTLAVYIPRERAILINNKHSMWRASTKETSRQQTLFKEFSYRYGTTPLTAIVHELVHYFHHQLASFSWYNTYRTLSITEMYAAACVSNYAQTNTFEMVAETFTQAIVYGVSFDYSVHGLLQTILGKDYPKMYDVMEHGRKNYVALAT